MKITKYLHSCLIVQEAGKTIIIDPGQYTYDAAICNLQHYPKIDYLLVTHEHSDHMYLPFIKDIIGTFPQIKILSNPSVAQKLINENIPVISQPDSFIEFAPIPHESVFDIQVPQNLVFEINHILTHPGDSHQLGKTAPILALPMQAPWGHVTAAMELAKKLKPKFIVPIHDWHWKDEVRKDIYKRAEIYLKQFGITFIPLETGSTVQI